MLKIAQNQLGIDHAANQSVDVRFHPWLQHELSRKQHGEVIANVLQRCPFEKIVYSGIVLPVLLVDVFIVVIQLTFQTLLPFLVMIIASGTR